MLAIVRSIAIVLAALALPVAPAIAGQQGASVGFDTLTIPAGQSPAIDVAVWYPSASPAATHNLGGSTQRVAESGALASGRRFLVVISHGGGGWYGGHRDTAWALAHAGFVVAALTHPGDNSRDLSRAADMAARPRDLKRVVDYMLTRSRWRGTLDQRHVGVFGFSNGGFTALVSLGGVPDFARFGPHCVALPDRDDCRILRESGICDDDLLARFPVSAWVHDRRITAGVVAAPALGFLFTRDGLRTVHAPLQLWRAADDRVLPNPDYAEAVRLALPQAPEYHVVPRAGHFDFLAPCEADQAAAVNPICRSAPGFDRAAFHRRFDARVVSFFLRTLNRRSGSTKPPRVRPAPPGRAR